MVTERQLTDAEWLLETTADDSEEAPWMTMPDFQWRVIALLMSILRRYMGEQPVRWYLAAELKVTMQRRPRGSTTDLAPGHRRRRRTLDLGPDLMVAKAADIERQSWNVRIEGAPPDLVLEVVTGESWRRDTVEKPILYDLLGVREYVIFAPQRKDGGPTLFGYHRDRAGRWIDWAPDGRGMLRSEVLGGLRFYVEAGRWLRLRDQRGRRLPSDAEAAAQEAARAEQEAARAEQEAARAEQEAARAEQEAARAEQEAALRREAERRTLVAEERAAASEAAVAQLQALLGQRSDEPPS